MAVTRGTGLADFASGLGNVLVVDANNNRVGVNSASPSEALSVVGDANISGALTATAFVGDGSELTGVSGFATALSSDQTSPLNVFFKTPKQVNIGAGTSVQIE